MKALTKWMGALFAIGAFLFGLGSVPPYFNSVSPETGATTFFVGSLFFTTAAYLQYLLSINETSPVSHWPDRLHLHKGVLAAAVQLLGTLFFNLSTWAALDASREAGNVARVVWGPDALGSFAFLLSSAISILIVRGENVRVVREAVLNLAGSMAFAIAALASFISPSTGNPLNESSVNQWTLIGAALFFVAAVLSLLSPTSARAIRPS